MFIKPVASKGLDGCWTPGNKCWSTWNKRTFYFTRTLMCSLDRSSEHLYWPIPWSHRVRLTSLLCSGKETASPGLGQGGYTHRHPEWPTVEPGGHTYPGHSRYQCAARCSYKRDTRCPVMAPTICLSNPLLLYLHPGLVPISHLDHSLNLLPASPSPVSLSSNILCSVTRMSFLKLSSRRPLHAQKPHCMLQDSVHTP